MTGLVADVLRDAGLDAGAVAALATVRARAADPGLRDAAARLGVPLVAYPARRLARVGVPNPSGAAEAAVGTPSVAEAAALAGGGTLLVRKTKSAVRPARVTCAIACRPATTPPS